MGYCTRKRFYRWGIIQKEHVCEQNQSSSFIYIFEKYPCVMFPFIAQGHVNWNHSSRTISSPLFYIDTFFLINSSKRDNIWVAQNFWQWVNWVFFMVSKNLVLFHEITWCRACACDQWFFSMEKKMKVKTHFQEICFLNFFFSINLFKAYFINFCVII